MTNQQIKVCENAKPVVRDGEMTFGCAPTCFLCNGAARISLSPEGQGWYKVRKHCLAVARGDRARASDLVGKYQAQYDAHQKGQVRDSMGNALARIELHRTR